MNIEHFYSTYFTAGKISIDSRKIKHNDVFFAFSGERFNAAIFAENAIEQGAKAVIVEDENYVQPDKNIFYVSSTLKFLQELALHHRKQLNIPIIALTGSNGKTTTTSLIYHIFKEAGYDVSLAGNIGKSLALQVAEAPHAYYIIEISSFQLDDMYDFRANTAVLLNITPDHLDRYEYKMQLYTDAKMRIIQNQTKDDSFVYWADDEVVAAELHKYNIEAQQLTFSEYASDSVAACVDNGEIVVKKPVEFTMPRAELSLLGRHNLYNSLAAALAAAANGVDIEAIKHGLRTFAGVEHRLEYVTTANGVRYINDSKATNVDACRWALESMTTPTILILGGLDKGNDYNEIKQLVLDKCKALVFMGADNSVLHQFFDGLGVEIADTHSMEECMKECKKRAVEGDTILLSPCCASFDLFKNMEDRGEQFKTWARKA